MRLRSERALCASAIGALLLASICSCGGGGSATVTTGGDGIVGEGGGGGAPEDPSPGAPAEEGPFFYLVLHADPAAPDARRDGVPDRWERLRTLLGDLRERGAGHHVTIMLTGPWIDWLAGEPEAAAELRGWIDEGHQVAFHSHTHNHSFRDGYTNARDVFGPDADDVCWRADAAECTLDAALETLRGLLPEGYDMGFAALGPHGNGGDPPFWGANDNTCNPELVDGVPQADEDGCVQAEWVGEIARDVHATSGAYPGLTPENRDDPASILGDSGCVRWGEAPRDVYYLPHAAFETESSKTEVSLETLEAAFERAGPGDLIGVVVHPVSYVHVPTSAFDGDGVARVQALLDAAEARGLRSHTLAEVRAADAAGGGAACR